MINRLFNVIGNYARHLFYNKELKIDLAVITIHIQCLTETHRFCKVKTYEYTVKKS